MEFIDNIIIAFSALKFTLKFARRFCMKIYIDVCMKLH